MSSEPRPTIPLRRLFLLTIVTAVFAFVIQAALAAANVPGAYALNLVLVPLAAGTIVFLGMRPYPLAGRIRLAIMVAVALLLLGLLIS